MSGDNITLLQCLGRPFQLGMLYDCRNDQLVPGMTLWNEKLLRAALSERPQPSCDFEIIAEDTLSNKIFSLGVEANLSLSLMGGLVSVSGAAKYLDDRKSSKNQARVTLKYYCTSRFEQLTMEQLAVSNIQHPEVFDKGIATHVVIGILYGAEAFFVFDREVTHSDNYRDIHGNLEVFVKALPGISDIKGSADVNIKDNDKQEVDKFQCKFYGDVILEENPSTFQDAVKVYRELPQLFGENGAKTVPKKVWLYPLHELDSKAAQMVRQISISIVTQTQQFLESLHVIQMRSNDLIKTKVYDYFPGYQHQLSRFREMINEFRVDFMKQIAAILPRIRGGGSEEGELAELLKRVHQSPFNGNSLPKWLDVKEGEIKVLSQYVDIMEKASGEGL